MTNISNSHPHFYLLVTTESETVYCLKEKIITNKAHHCSVVYSQLISRYSPTGLVWPVTAAKLTLANYRQIFPC